MRYLCTKQLTAGGVTYRPGEIIPDGVILPERSGKLLKSRYISDFHGKTEQEAVGEAVRLFTQEEVAARVAEALEEVEQRAEERLAERQGYAAEQGVDEPSILISVNGAPGGGNEQLAAIPAKAEEIRQVFSIMQLSAEEGVRAIADVKSENVLILLHAADSRKTVKNASREQADKLFSAGEASNESGKENEITGTGAEGADT